jgi:hypothetical protein
MGGSIQPPHADVGAFIYGMNPQAALRAALELNGGVSVDLEPTTARPARA